MVLDLKNHFYGCSIMLSIQSKNRKVPELTPYQECKQARLRQIVIAAQAQVINL